MATETLTSRERRTEPPEPRGRVDAALAHPLAFLATALVLLAAYGGTFVLHPDRVAPTKDPAYYTWRTEALISEAPVTLLEVEGAFDMFAGGYRVAAPVTAGMLRQIPGVSSLATTSLLMVLVPVLTSLLLAGFAYRHRRDPLIFHSVALAVGGLYLTPPFIGYLDNILGLMFLSAAIWFIGDSRHSWGARAGLFLFMLMSGFTHPTTLAFFCFSLGAMAFARLLFRRLDIRSVIRDDGPMLATGVAAAATTYVVWKLGIWGQSASLAEAALAPPYGSSFFIDRMMLWVAAMHPMLNGPLLAVGIIGLLLAGRRWVEDDLTRISIVWLAPLAGLFGFIGGLTYPYYRFFNTSVTWVVLIGVGGYFVMRLFVERARRGGLGLVALLGALAVVFVYAYNLNSGLAAAGWNDPSRGWLSGEERADLDALRARLAATTDEDTPVVFVIDDAARTFQIWGTTKLYGNTSRYSLPHGQVDQGYLYLGSLQSYLAGEPTRAGDETYEMLTTALLENVDEGIANSGEEPVVVVASSFNLTGFNAKVASGEETPDLPSDHTVWAVYDGEVTSLSGEASGDAGAGEGSAGPLHLLRVLAGMALLLVPGILAWRWFAPGATFAEALGMVPVLSIALVALCGIAVLAVTRMPLSLAPAAASLVLAALAGLLLSRLRARSPEAANAAAPG
ncbi:MAG: hypothetical protein ACREJS_03165 [Candidatus Rokuibacteriota bacterium]